MHTLITFHDGAHRTSQHGPYVAVEMIENKLLVQAEENGPRWVLARMQFGRWRQAGDVWPGLRFNVVPAAEVRAVPRLRAVPV